MVGGGNSGAQIAADLAGHADLTWCTTDPPRFLPDELDGRQLFRVATLRARDQGEGVGGLGDIVAVPPVRAARQAGHLRRLPMFERFTKDGVAWADGTVLPAHIVMVLAALAGRSGFAATTACPARTGLWPPAPRA